MHHSVEADIVGSVLSVPSRAGAVVVEGETIVVLESMKMEVPVVAHVGGTVVSVAVAPGDVVRTGDVVAVVDDAPG